MGKHFLLVRLVHFHFALQQTLVAFRHFVHFFRDMALSGVAFELIQFVGHEVVVRRGNFVDEDGSRNGVRQQFFSVMEVDESHAGHHGGTVDDSQTVAKVQFDR